MLIISFLNSWMEKHSLNSHRYHVDQAECVLYLENVRDFLPGPLFICLTNGLSDAFGELQGDCV